MTASDYDTRSWARHTTLGRRVFNHNFRMADKGPPGWTLVKVVPMVRDARRTETTWLWASKEAPKNALVQVNITELTDWRAAQKYLVTLLAHCMRPAIPRGAGNLAEAGDIIFVARDPVHDLQASAQLARGNVTAAIRSVGSISVDVSAFVKLVDAMLSGASTKNVTPHAERRLLSTRAADKGTVTVLPVDLGESHVWLRLIASNGELRRKGRTIVHLASDRGEATVELFAAR